MTRKSDMTPEKIELLERVGQKIVDVLKEVPLEVEGAPKTAVKYKDGGYKIKPIMGGWQFFMNYAYLGKKGEMIFGLEPEDAQEYEFAEFSCKYLDPVFPLAGSALSTKLGVFKTSSEEVSIAGNDKLSSVAMQVPEENFALVFDRLVIQEVEEMENAEKIAKRVYAENPNFGAF